MCIERKKRVPEKLEPGILVARRNVNGGKKCSQQRYEYDKYINGERNNILKEQAIKKKKINKVLPTYSGRVMSNAKCQLFRGKE